MYLHNLEETELVKKRQHTSFKCNCVFLGCAGINPGVSSAGIGGWS